ncbi:S-layer homology domain-containing protein [Neofamilia massiliensis]|uniref:S-layer homology domain-containing protein n=1 Tax=Neofamilia massiliensis TaxID=1673724 RepID=UPI0006BB541A|nr:S-layer homology domain-containing protein [Neofamilia massiliensis]
MVRKKLTKQTKGLVFLLILMLLVFTNGKNAFAAPTTVNTFAELKEAIADPSVTEIIVGGDITIDKTLQISRDIKISGGTLSAGDLKMDSAIESNMFYVFGEKTLTLENITLDGANKARIIFADKATVKMTNVTAKNGSTHSFAQTAGSDQNYSGGAIRAINGAVLNIKDGSFENNNTGSPTDNLATDRSAEGGAIKIEDSELIIDGTTFKDNHLDGKETRGGRQGGSIEATNTKATINNATFNIVGPFNTGGAIKFEDCGEARVTGSTFTIADGKGEFGVAGGAITSEGSNLTINDSKFFAGKGTRVQEAGGLIQVVETGSFNLIDSTLEGAGASWNAGKYTANTGGAISFYDDCEMTANITGTTIKNVMADGTGAGIALSKGNGHSSSVNLTLKNTTIENAAAYTWQGNSYGGCMYIGEGNTVKIEGGKISGQTTSNVAAGIYNMGDLEITGGAQITGNTAYQMVGGIYHGGSRLKIDEATISGNQKGDNSTGHNHYIEGKEKSGINIYADKDVIITPRATFDDNDVRVFDRQSSILLTGALTNKINVSISEEKKTTDSTNANIKVFEEDQHRKVGYVVANGTDGYTPTYLDAQKLHYDSNDTSQAIAAADKHDGIGEWDFVLNPKTKQVVLGQRVKLTLDANGASNTPAEFKNVSPDRDDVNGILTKLPSTDIKEDIYDIYEPGPKLAILDPIPVRKGYAFTGWYKESSVSDNAPDKGKDGKTLVEELDLVKGFPTMSTLSFRSNSNFEETNETDITTIINPPEYKLYAGWEKVILVEKVWDDEYNKYGNRPESVKVELLSRGRSVADPIELTAENDWKGEFKNIRPSKFEYTVKENPKKSPGYEEGVVSGNYKDGFKITNKTEFIDIEGSKTWDHTGNSGTIPTEVTVNLYENGNATGKSQTGASWKFEKLPKYKNKQEVNYTLKENPVENYTSAKGKGEYDFKNTYTDKYKVTYEFVSGTEDKTLPKEVTNLVPAEEKDKKNGTKVTPSTSSFADVTTEDGTWKFNGWEPTEQIINGADVKFVGTWTFKEKKSDFTITKTVDKTTYEKAGEVLTYTVTVKNTGEKDLTGLIISDDKTTFENPTFNLTLKEKTKTFTYKYTVTEADVKAKKVTNTASVKLEEDGEPKEASTTSTLIEKNSDFTVTKTVDKATYEKSGEELTYTVTVKNTGEKKLTGLKITDNLVTLTEDAFDLDVNAKKTFNYKYTVTENDIKAKSILNVATVKDVVNNKEVSAKATSKLRESQPEPQPPITPEYPDYSPLLPFIFGSGDSYTPSEKIILNKDDHKAYMFGYPDWTFRPNNNMTRAEVTTMFARLLKNYPSTDRKYNLPYGDVFESDWYYPAVGFMTENGIIKGYEDGTFRPNSPITRAEFATIASKFEELVGIEDRSFDDVPLDHWALVYINSAYARGWVKGYEDGSFRPDRNITRAEVVTVTNKMLNRYADEDFVITHKYELIDFKDLDQSHWAYFNIMEATHGHDYTRKSNKIDELWHRLNGEAFIFPELSYEDR